MEIVTSGYIRDMKVLTSVNAPSTAGRNTPDTAIERRDSRNASD